jgi:hypothetical protein
MHFCTSIKFELNNLFKKQPYKGHNHLINCGKNPAALCHKTIGYSE